MLQTSDVDDDDRDEEDGDPNAGVDSILSEVSAKSGAQSKIEIHSVQPVLNDQCTSSKLIRGCDDIFEPVVHKISKRLLWNGWRNQDYQYVYPVAKPSAGSTKRSAYTAKPPAAGNHVAISPKLAYSGQGVSHGYGARGTAGCSGHSKMAFQDCPGRTSRSGSKVRTITTYTSMPTRE